MHIKLVVYKLAKHSFLPSELDIGLVSIVFEKIKEGIEREMYRIIKQDFYDKTYNQTEKGKTRRQQYNESEERKQSLKKYKQSEKGKQKIKQSLNNYQQSEKYRELMKTDRYKDIRCRFYKRYMQTEKGKQVIAKYHQSEKYKLMMRKTLARRQRDLNFIPLFLNPFPEDIDIHYHHINNILVIPLPKKVHLNNLGKDHRDKCEYWIERLYCLTLTNILKI